MTKYLRVAAQLRKLETQAQPKPEPVVEQPPVEPLERPEPHEEVNLISGLNGSQWRTLFEVENIVRGDSGVTFSQNQWLPENFPGEKPSPTRQTR
jgi:hypothetical protein